MNQGKQIKIALVGCGGIAQAHWRGIQAVPEIVVTATVDTDPIQAERMAAQTGGRAFTSLESALAEGDFDAVDIMLPHNLHEEAATMAFAAGKHVVLEKPMSTTLASCDRILAAAKNAGTVFMVAEQSQYWPDACKAQELIQAGKIGELVTARAYFGEVITRNWGMKPWRFEKEKMGGGISMDGGAHFIRPLRMWMGEVEEVVSVIGHPIEEVEGETMSRSLLRFANGTVGVFDVIARRTNTSFVGEEEFRISGTEGEIVIERSAEGRLLLFNADNPSGEVILTKGDGRMDSFGYELKDFALAVLENKPLDASPEYSLGDLRTALAIYRSAESRQWEKVWE